MNGKTSTSSRVQAVGDTSTFEISGPFGSTTYSITLDSIEDRSGPEVDVNVFITRSNDNAVAECSVRFTSDGGGFAEGTTTPAEAGDAMVGTIAASSGDTITVELATEGFDGGSALVSAVWGAGGDAPQSGSGLLVAAPLAAGLGFASVTIYNELTDS